MAKAVKSELVEIQKLDENKLKEFDGIKEKQLDIVKANPFVEITDKETYEKAKATRTALLTASTDVEKQETTVSRFLNNFKKAVKEKYESLSQITREPYDKQQAEVKRYEDILQAEKDRKAKEEQDRIDGIKQSIADKEVELINKIVAMQYTDIEATEKTIEEIISQSAGTFEEYDVLFDKVVENVRERLKIQINSVTDAHLKAEQERKEKHQQKIKDIIVKAKEYIFNMDFETMLNYKTNITNLVDTDYDFEEYAKEFKTEKESVWNLYDTTCEKLKKDEENRIKQEEQEKEIKELREEKLYNNRSAVLTEIGMVKQENGDFVVFDIVYQKQFIISDTDEIFDGTVQNVSTQIKIKSAPVQDEEVVAPAPAEAVAEEVAEVQGEAVAEEVPAEVVEEAQEKHVQIGTPTTVGELRSMLKKYGDSTKLQFRNQPRQTLFEGDYAGDIIIYFQE